MTEAPGSRRSNTMGVEEALIEPHRRACNCEPGRQEPSRCLGGIFNLLFMVLRGQGWCARLIADEREARNEDRLR